MNQNSYIQAVLKSYLQLPDTPARARPHDRHAARLLWERQIPLDLAQAALLLASARRARPANQPQLPPIRSLAYFIPVIDEILLQPLPPGYVDYLKIKTGAQSKNRVS
jgi:hypothetical protein